MARGAFDGRYGGGHKLWLLVLGVILGFVAYSLFKSGHIIWAILVFLMAIGAVFGG